MKYKSKRPIKGHYGEDWRRYMTPCSLRFHDETNEVEWQGQRLYYNKYVMLVVFFFKIFDTISKFYTAAHE